MATLTKKITATVKANDLRPRWHVLDADGQVLGRLAVQVAHLLKGKHKPNYSPHMLTGDFVVVVNAAKVRVTGRKADQKVYFSHSQYPGGLKEVPFRRMMAKHPSRVVEHAVKGMLPHNRLGRQMMRRLKVYSESEHPHESQIEGSLRAVEKDREEGTVWIGLPKPQYKKRPIKEKKTAKVEPEAPVTEEAPAEIDVPEEPTAVTEPVVEHAEPAVDADDAVEVAEPTAEATNEPIEAGPAAEVEDAEASEGGTEEEQERGA